MAIEEIMDVTGFVPQDDIVYAELTVRENFLFAGKLRLPKGTSIEEIEDLAEKVLANLGLSRVADSLVGDVKRRGVSGGEKKRVNIGLELMARPSCLFLDEPTSGLDSSSALVVMSSLENLVRTEGVTIVSVIHQPRKFIFDLFDSLVLLGAGGRIVYHGRTSDAQDYFSNLEYVLPQGEALADWLIDISSGRIHPEPEIAATKALEAEKKKKKSKGKKKKKKKKKRSKAPPKKDERGVQWQSSGLSDEDNDSDDPDLSRPRSSNLSDPDQARTNFQFHSFGVGAIATKRGVTTGIADEAITDAALRRQILYEEWEGYFKRLPMKDREMYDVPEEFKLPSIPQKTPFLSQFYHQLSRASLVSRRNGSSKLFDTTILIVAIIVLTLVSGLPELTRKYDPSIPFASIVNPTEDSMESMTGELFRYATSPQVM
jgi:ABC-type multidrug transport system ATPase subunit